MTIIAKFKVIIIVEAKYKIKNVRLKYIGECDYREYKNGFDKQYFKIVDPITLSDKFKHLIVDSDEFGVVKMVMNILLKLMRRIKLNHINLKYNKFYISDLAISITPGRTIYIDVSNITTLNSRH
jgi:hypothetical protein